MTTWKSEVPAAVISLAGFLSRLLHHCVPGLGLGAIRTRNTSFGREAMAAPVPLALHSCFLLSLSPHSSFPPLSLSYTLTPTKHKKSKPNFILWQEQQCGAKQTERQPNPKSSYLYLKVQSSSHRQQNQRSGGLRSRDLDAPFLRASLESSCAAPNETQRFLR